MIVSKGYPQAAHRDCNPDCSRGVRPQYDVDEILTWPRRASSGFPGDGASRDMCFKDVLVETMESFEYLCVQQGR